MPHCGGANSCNCVVTGDGVSGSGTLSDPYVITSVPEGGGVTDHGALTGLGDDDHALYALADGTRGSFAAPLGADDNYVTDAEKAALHAHSNKAALDLVSGTNTGDQVLPTWSTISGKPAVVAEGATQADARTAIGAGTSSFSGVYADLTSKPTLGTAAATASTDYATAAQGVLAGTASQPGHAHAGADITSGTVAAARLPAASDTASGIVELATTAETTTGTDTTRAVTAAGVKAVADTKAATSHSHAASDVTSGTMATARLGSGTASGTTFLRGDQTWATPSGGSDPWTYAVATADTSSGDAGATVNINGLSATALADGLYEFRAVILCTSQATGTGARPGIITPTGCTATIWHIGPNNAPANGAILGAGPAAITNSSFVSYFVASPVATSTFVASVFEGVVRASSMSGSLHMTITSELSGPGTAATAKADSFIAYRLIGS